MVVFTAGAKGSTRLTDGGEIGLETEDVVFALSDGMGGKNAGELASALIMDKISAIIPDTFKAAASGLFPDSLAYLKDVLRQVHEELELVGKDFENRKGMGGTVALAWFSPESLYLANVGDSRIYRCREKLTEQLSTDHTAVWAAWKRGELSEAEYRTHPRRAALYQAIGGGQSNIHPHLAALPYQKGDRYLICSDGLIDGLWERRIASLLSEGQNTQAVCDQMLTRAYENSGFDDLSLIVIEVA